MSDASSSSEYDAFLTHDWGDDELGRSNHARVAEVNRLLKAAGFVTWFDEDRMQGDIGARRRPVFTAPGRDATGVFSFVAIAYV